MSSETQSLHSELKGYVLFMRSEIIHGAVLLTALFPISASVACECRSIDRISNATIDITWANATSDDSAHYIYHAIDGGEFHRSALFLADPDSIEHSRSFHAGHDLRAWIDSEICFSISAIDDYGFESPRSDPVCALIDK